MHGTFFCDFPGFPVLVGTLKQPLKYIQGQCVFVITPYIYYKGVEISCPTCPTGSHFIQDILEISMSWDKYKVQMQFCISYLIKYFELACCLEDSVDPDQLASAEAS